VLLPAVVLAVVWRVPCSRGETLWGFLQIFQSGEAAVLTGVETGVSDVDASGHGASWLFFPGDLPQFSSPRMPVPGFDRL